jgi:flagellar biosynthesis/type III secretory pathway M-ring protein FliF/YscJ
VERPYAFLSFDKFIKETAKLFSDSDRKNIKKLNEDLEDIQNIMKSSIKELVERGNKLEHLNKIGTDILDDSKKFKNKAIWMNKFHCLRIYYPVIIVLAVVLFVLIIRWKYY